MRRIFTTLVVVATSVVFGTTTAVAKEIGAVQLTGPGIDGSMQLNDADVARWHNLNVRQPRSRPAAHAGSRRDLRGDVGGRRSSYSGESPPRIPVEIYPFAQGGMLLHVERRSLRYAAA